MQIEPLNLSHQDLIQRKFLELNFPLSEFSFANLYLFRHLHRYEVVKIEENIFIKGLSRDQVPYIMLTHPSTEISQLILRQEFLQNQILFPIPEDWLKLWEKKLMQTSFKEADNDYIYATSKIAHYPGRHLDGKRNQVKQFLDNYEVKSENLIQQFDDAQQILEMWQKENGINLNQTDFSSCQEAIQNLQLLNLHGRITYVDQTPAGLMIGEWLTQDCYVVHFSKALRSYKGIYQYLYQDLALAVEGTCTWMNLEQDLGIPSLRISKLSYQPDMLLKKWRVQLQQG